MANVIIDSSILDALAQMIAAKSGEALPLSLSDMIDAVHGIGAQLQDKTINITPSAAAQTQTVTADSAQGYDGLNEVTVETAAVPMAEIGHILIEGNGINLSVGVVNNKAYVWGSLINYSGLSEKPFNSSGWVDQNAEVTVLLNEISDVEIPSQAAQTIYPSANDQTIAADKYLTGAQTIKGVQLTNLLAANIKQGVTVQVGDADDTDRIASVIGTYAGGSSGGGLTLISTTALGAISGSATSATDTGKSLSLAAATNFTDYDALLVDVSVDTLTNGRHTSTVCLIYLTGSSNVNTKNTYAVGSNKWNSKLSSSGTGSTRQSTTAYGIYPYSATVSNGVMSIPLYYRYNSNYTGTINGNYTARVYGLKLYDLIGG